MTIPKARFHAGPEIRRLDDDALRRINRDRKAIEHEVSGRLGPRTDGWVTPQEFGAAGDGVRDDTDALKRALSAAEGTFQNNKYSKGAGLVFLPPGIYAISGVIDVPNHVDIVGAGSGMSVLLCTDAAAKLRFGERTANPTNRGSLSGRFTVDGDDTATNPFFVGLSVTRTFADIHCVGATGDGMILEATQNCTFIQVNSQEHGTTATPAGSSLVLDYGAGANVFVRCSISEGAEYHIEFRQSGSSPSGAGSVPNNNLFIGCISERIDTNTAAMVRHGAGQKNTFSDCIFALQDTSGTVLQLRKDGTDTSSKLTFHNCRWNGGTSAVALDADDATDLALTGTNRFNNFDTAFKIGDNVTLDVDALDLTSVTTFFANNGGGSNSADQLVRTNRTRPLVITRGSTTDLVFGVFLDGDSQFRARLRSGSLIFGDGSSAPDAGIFRSAADVISMLSGDSFKMDGTFDGGHLQLGDHHIWVDGTGDLRIKDGAPSTATDGTVVGNQS